MWPWNICRNSFDACHPIVFSIPTNKHTNFKSNTLLYCIYRGLSTCFGTYVGNHQAIVYNFSDLGKSVHKNTTSQQVSQLQEKGEAGHLF
jgi:hypothetical protein